MKARSLVAAAVAAASGVAAYDLVQRRHAILRNFPIVGHLRFILEAIGPELRQYIVTDNDQERPFSRDQRRWVYASAKGENNWFGFGTDNDLDRAAEYVIVKHVAFPRTPPPDEPRDPDPARPLPAAKVLGGARGRARALRPSSVVNLSAMSFGSLSGPAVEALNRGAALAGCLQSTGEGGISPHHRHGGDLVWQIGTGYFGCRDAEGRFDLERLVDRVAADPAVRAIEIKLSQGAKPGLGGFLPGEKVSPEIAEIRGIPVGADCRSPAAHTAFRDIDGMLELVETIAERTGLPVGVKSAVGETAFWDDLALRMDRTGRGVDFITIDGGEGGTGAAPLTFSDHVALPFMWGFTRVFARFAERGLEQQVVWVGSGKLGMPERALSAMAVGCDLVNVGRTAMFSIGCVQAQRCHTGRCPSGVATQSPWLARGLDPGLKSVRCARYVATLRHELLRLARACGEVHPALVTPSDVEIIGTRYESTTLAELFGYRTNWGRPSIADTEAIRDLMAAAAGPGGGGPEGTSRSA